MNTPRYDFGLMLKRVLGAGISAGLVAFGAGVPAAKVWPFVITGVASAFGVDLHSFAQSQK